MTQRNFSLVLPSVEDLLMFMNHKLKGDKNK